MVPNLPDLPGLPTPVDQPQPRGASLRFVRFDPERLRGRPSVGTTLRTRSQPVVHPKVKQNGDGLVSGMMFKIAGDDCVRCGGDLSRGFAVARDIDGAQEDGLVCLCCDWLDESERDSRRVGG